MRSPRIGKSARKLLYVETARPALTRRGDCSLGAHPTSSHFRSRISAGAGSCEEACIRHAQQALKHHRLGVVAGRAGLHAIDALARERLQQQTPRLHLV